MRCGAFTKRVSAYLEGELGSVDRARMERHMSLCRGCAERLEGVTKVRTSLRTMAKAEVSPAFSLELKSRLRWIPVDRRSLGTRVSAFAASIGSLPTFAAFGAAATLGALLLFGRLDQKDAPSILELPPPAEVAEGDAGITNYVLRTLSPLELDRVREGSQLPVRDGPSEEKMGVRQVVF